MSNIGDPFYGDIHSWRICKRPEGGDVLLDMLNILILFFTVVYTVLYAAILIVGLILCKKHSFSGGFYFFLLLLVGRIHYLIVTFLLSPLIKNYVDAANAATERPLGMTIGELVAWFAYTNHFIKHTIEISAFSFLVFGLYRMWKSKIIRS